jgi:hypothetical protein
MLTYTPVTDIVRFSDELRQNVQGGVLILGSELNATFMNRRMRRFWEVSEDAADPPA